MPKKHNPKVVIYALYNDNDKNYYECIEDYNKLLSRDCNREEELKKYCKEKQYEVKEIVRTSNGNYLPYKLKCFIELVYKYRTIYSSNPYLSKLNKVIVYDIYELCNNISEFNVIFEMASEENIEIETIKQGKINNNSFKEELSGNEN